MSDWPEIKDEDVKSYDGKDLELNELELEEVGIEGVACRCHCGYRSRLMTYAKSFWVECTRKDCWTGPVVSRRDKAVDAWDRVQSRFNKEAK